MSRIPLGSNVKNGPGRAIPKSYFAKWEYTSQFEGAERIARKWEITRDDAELVEHRPGVGVGVVVAEVPAVDVVDVAVAVVVDAVARDLSRIRPQVGGDVGMEAIDAGVDAETAAV